jgi:hypothetical protein
MKIASPLLRPIVDALPNGHKAMLDSGVAETVDYASILVLTGISGSSDGGHRI